MGGSCEATVFIINYAEGVAADLADIRAFERKQLLDQIERQLLHEPTGETRNRQILRGLTPPLGAYKAGLGVACK